MALSFTAVNAAKGRAKPYKLADSDGLYLFVTPEGGRYWRMNYRHERKQRTLAFGVFPETGLADARAKRDAARKLLANGEDPSARRKNEEREARQRSRTPFELSPLNGLPRSRLKGARLRRCTSCAGFWSSPIRSLATDQSPKSLRRSF